MAFFISEAGDTDLTLDIGFYGREEFVLFASAVGFFVALFSMIVAILGAQENSHWAATVCIIIFSMKLNWKLFNACGCLSCCPAALLLFPSVSQPLIKDD